MLFLGPDNLLLHYLRSLQLLTHETFITNNTNSSNRKADEKLKGVEVQLINYNGVLDGV